MQIHLTLSEQVICGRYAPQKTGIYFGFTFKKDIYMTAIYCYFSPKYDLSFMAADDIEYTNARKVDKVHLINERYFLACYGQDIVDLSINVIAYFQALPGYCDLTSADAIIMHLVEITRQISTQLYPVYLRAFQSGKIIAENWEIIKKNALHVIILDTKSQELKNINLGSAFPPERILSNPLINSSFEPNKLHRFALATKVKNRSLDVIDINPDISRQIENIISSDKIEIPQIGVLGTFLMHHQGSLTTKSAFKNIDEYISHAFNPNFQLGFNINVYGVSP